jgi:hypothetical protein
MLSPMEARMTLRFHNALGAAAFALVTLGCKKDPCDGTSFRNDEAGFCLKLQGKGDLPDECHAQEPDERAQEMVDTCKSVASIAKK